MTATTATPTPTPTALPLPNELILLAEAQWLFSESDLLHTPSVIAGLTPTQERENRAKGVNFILQVGIMLKLPQITLATASVFLHRFFMRYSMIEDRVAGRQHQHYYSIAATCLFLATKVEENCRKMKDLVVACVRVAQKEPNKEVDEQDKEFWRWRDVLLQLEDLLLEALCFDLSLESPYKLLYTFLVHFQEENNKPLRNAAWAFVNDSCLTPLCLLYPARTIAAAAIYAAARHCDVKLLDDEKGRPWWEVAGSDLNSIRQACNYMASLYENVPTSSSNGDSGKNSIYQHTPESSGEERFAKTRAYRPGVSPRESGQSSPLSGPLNHSQPLQSTRDRAIVTSNGDGSLTPSERSRKRDRDSSTNGDETNDGEGEEGEIHSSKEDRSDSEHTHRSKRQRTLSNSPSRHNNHSNHSQRQRQRQRSTSRSRSNKPRNETKEDRTAKMTTNGTHRPPSSSERRRNGNGTSSGNGNGNTSSRKPDAEPEPDGDGVEERDKGPAPKEDEDEGNGSEEGEL